MLTNEEILIQSKYLKFDHYSTLFTFIFGIMNIVFSLIIIILFYKYKEVRKHPFDIIIGSTFSDLILSIHWFISSIYTIWISNVFIEENSNFCLINSIISTFACYLEYTYEISFLTSIIISYKIGIRGSKIKRIYFHIIPIIFSLISTIVNHKNFGINFNGFCGLKNSFLYLHLLIFIMEIFLGIFCLIITIKYLELFKVKLKNIGKYIDYY